VLNDVPLPEMGEDEEAMPQRFMSNQTAIRLSNPITKILEGLELELSSRKKKRHM
jgi:2Fe-2S ferredoxin